AIIWEQETMRVVTAMSEISGAVGRFDTLRSKNGVVGIVDYAHTPDAVANVLDTIRNLRQPTQQIITVLGCGGDREKTKRPEMADTAVKLSDKVNITSDNPRTEDAMQIIKDMEAGVDTKDRNHVCTIEDRKKAMPADI